MTFIVHFSSQCAYSKKVMPLWGRLLGFADLLFNCTTKNFLILRSNYIVEDCLELHELSVIKMGPKCNYLVDFLITSLPNMRAYAHAYCCLLFKAGCETLLVEM